MISAVITLALFIAAIAGLVLWSRRGETSVDRPGVRSIATFRSDASALTPGEREAEKRDGRGALGKGLATALAERLREGGLSVDPPTADDYGWMLAVREKRDTAYLLLGATEDDQEATIPWAMSVVDDGGRPGARALPHIDAALRKVPGVEGVRWHKRERHLAGDTSSGSDHPFGD